MTTTSAHFQYEYQDFLESKRQLGGQHGFEPVWMPSFLFDFQQSLLNWGISKGRQATFADCGLGKTPMQLVWAENVVRHTGVCGAIVNGRRGVGAELKPSYFKQAIKNVEECAAQGWGEEQPSMFDELEVGAMDMDAVETLVEDIPA